MSTSFVKPFLNVGSHSKQLIRALKIRQYDVRQLSIVTTCTSSKAVQRRQNGSSILQSAKNPLKIQLYSISSTPVLFESQTVNCPPFAESISEGDVRWEKAVGDVVGEDEMVAEIETDKTSIPIASPHAGIIEQLLIEDGTTVTPGTPLFVINIGADAGASSSPPAASEETPPADEPVKEAPKEVEQEQPKASAPAATPTTLPPAPPIPSQPMSSQPLPQPVEAATGTIVAPDTGDARTESRVKMNRMRLRIAQRLKDSQNTAAMLTTFNEVDMTNLIALRNKYKEDFLKKHGIKLSFMSGFIKASAYALIDQPVVNAVIDDDSKEIIYRDYVDVSVAVATPRGLVVPVLRNCENKDFFEIEQAMNNLAQKARNNDLAVEDMDGGTFTISNGGVFGSMFGTPIINPPQSAILGMHGIFDRPVAINKQVEIRPMMYIALTYDHRLVDGREAVTFLRKIKQAVEEPAVVLLGL